MNQEIDWVRIFIITISVLVVLCLFLMFALFGIVVMYVLILVLLIGIIVVLSALLIRSIRIIVAASAGLNQVLDEVSQAGDEFEAEVKRLVWPEDTPQFRKLSKILFRAKSALMNAPITLSQIAGDVTPMPQLNTDPEPVEVDEAWMEELYKKIDTQEND